VFSNSDGPSPPHANAPACISVEETGATPRPTNRGVTSTERGERTSEALIDWLEWTEHEASIDDVCARLSDDWIEGDRGAMGYRRSRLSEGTFVLYDGRAGMGVHVRMPGKACRAIEAAGRVTEWEPFLGMLLERGRSITRLDVAFDDRTGSVSVDRCYREMKAGHLVRNFRVASAPEYVNALGETESRTLYFGSQKSDLRVRIYDKALEAKRPGPWTRVEMQARDEHAIGLAGLVTAAPGNERSAAFGQLLLHYLDFKDPGRDGNRSRWDTAPWWSEFVLSCLKRKLALEPARLPSADEAIGRVAQQYGPTLAAVVAYTGYEPLFEAIEAARPRLRTRHRRMLAEWRGGS
jgi:phage replication initiation protein